jgi:hypothetical protein
MPSAAPIQAIAIGLFTLAVTSCTGDVPTTNNILENPVAAPSAQAIPFKARYDWRVVAEAPAPGCDGPGEARAFLEGEGNGTHLGNFTISLNHCGRPGLPLSDGHGTFVAANGDLLHITYFGVGGLTGTFPVFNFESRVEFVGGSGRFANATGTATVLGTIDVTVLAGTGDWQGEISLPAGD